MLALLFDDQIDPNILEYAVHDEIGGCMIVIYFHTCCKLFIMCFLRGALRAFESFYL